jgi:uncharacterized membrane protein YgcG
VVTLGIGIDNCTLMSGVSFLLLDTLMRCRSVVVGRSSSLALTKHSRSVAGGAAADEEEEASSRDETAADDSFGRYDFSDLAIARSGSLVVDYLCPSQRERIIEIRANRMEIAAGGSLHSDEQYFQMTTTTTTTNHDDKELLRLSTNYLYGDIGVGAYGSSGSSGGGHGGDGGESPSGRGGASYGDLFSPSTFGSYGGTMKWLLCSSFFALIAVCVY